MTRKGVSGEMKRAYWHQIKGFDGYVFVWRGQKRAHITLTSMGDWQYRVFGRNGAEKPHLSGYSLTAELAARFAELGVAFHGLPAVRRRTQHRSLAG